MSALMHANTHYLWHGTDSQRVIDERKAETHATKLCACGKPALYQDRGKAWCKACKP